MGMLRFCLALAVVLHHADFKSIVNIQTLGGGAAVFCFFVISGFYMEMVLSTKYTKERLGGNFFLLFYTSRYFRLFPIYFLVVLTAFIISLSTGLLSVPAILQTRPTDIISGLHYLISIVANTTMLLTNWPSLKDLIISPVWSVGVEISFYILAPFLLQLRLSWLTLLFTIGLVLQFVSFGQHSPILFGVHFFIFGALLYRWRAALLTCRVGIFMVNQRWLLYLILLLLIFYAMPTDLWLGQPDAHAHNLIDRLVYPFIIGILIPWLHESSSSCKIDFNLGQLSYPFYLLHQPLLDLFGHTKLSAPVSLSAVILLGLLISALLMILERKFIEPFRSRFSEPQFPKEKSRSQISKNKPA